jgi:hypothetical protein
VTSALAASSIRSANQHSTETLAAGRAAAGDSRWRLEDVDATVMLPKQTGSACSVRVQACLYFPPSLAVRCSDEMIDLQLLSA